MFCLEETLCVIDTEKLHQDEIPAESGNKDNKNAMTYFAYHVVQVPRCLLELFLRRRDHERGLCEGLTRALAPSLLPPLLPLFLRHADAAVQRGCNAVQLG